jgi:Fe-S-cluster containining protein
MKTDSGEQIHLYRCDECGACCRQHKIEADVYDAIREPRIAERAELDDRQGTLPLSEAVFRMNPGKDGTPCVFQVGNCCSIWHTRPDICTAYPPGGIQCQTSRKREGLSPLAAIRIDEPALAERIDAVFQQECFEQFGL